MFFLTNWPQLHLFCEEEWVKITENYCERVVEVYPKNLVQARLKGNSNKC